MAWNPNIPVVTNNVQDDLNAIRENFQHLDPLAPYIQAILNSRIVEMGTNSNGTYVRWENGLQICWAIRTITGITPLIHNIQGLTFYRSDLSARWFFPATFVGAPAAMAMGVRLYKDGVQVLDRTSSPTMFDPNATETRMDFQFVSLSEFDEARDVPTIAIGRWK